MQNLWLFCKKIFLQLPRFRQLAFLLDVVCTSRNLSQVIDTPPLLLKCLRNVKVWCGGENLEKDLVPQIFFGLPLPLVENHFATIYLVHKYTFHSCIECRRFPHPYRTLFYLSATATWNKWVMFLKSIWKWSLKFFYVRSRDAKFSRKPEKFWKLLIRVRKWSSYTKFSFLAQINQNIEHVANYILKKVAGLKLCLWWFLKTRTMARNALLSGSLSKNDLLFEIHLLLQSIIYSRSNIVSEKAQKRKLLISGLFDMNFTWFPFFPTADDLAKHRFSRNLTTYVKPLSDVASGCFWGQSHNIVPFVWWRPENSPFDVLSKVLEIFQQKFYEKRGKFQVFFISISAKSSNWIGSILLLDNSAS